MRLKACPANDSKAAAKSVIAVVSLTVAISDSVIEFQPRHKYDPVVATWDGRCGTVFHPEFIGIMASHGSSNSIGRTDQGTGSTYSNIQADTVNSGYFQAQNQYFVSNSRKEFGGSYFDVDLVTTSTFTPRTRHQALIWKQLECQEDDQEHKLLVIYGLGGSGKTQLAIAYLQDSRRNYSATFWIDASSKDSIERDFLQIYRDIFLIGQGCLDFDIKTIILAVKRWLQHGAGRRLVVFDGADEIVDQEDPLFVDLETYLPRTPGVHVIITTRVSTASKISSLDPVHVEEMAREEALTLFRKCSQVTDQVEAAETILEELGHLALAITLAGTYISKDPDLITDLRRYLKKYRRKRKQLLEWCPQHLLHRYGKSVLATWETSFQAVERQSEVAARLLTALAFLDFPNIFLDLFRSTVALDTTQSQDNAVLPSWQALVSPEQPADLDTIKDALQFLMTYCFVDRSPNQKQYSMHKLVNSWGYERLKLPQQLRYSSATLKILVDVVAASPANPVYKRQIVPHAMANFHICESLSRTDEGIISVCDQLLSFESLLDEIGDWSQIYRICKFRYEKGRWVLGEEHPDTISAMNNLASTLGDQGKLDEAASMQQEVLEKRRRVLGDEHPNTISVMNNLASTLGNQGKLDEAASMKQEVLEKSRRVLGDEHPDTTRAMNNLAITLGNQGKLDEAASMQQEVLEKSRRVLGDEHPDTISAMNNLACTLGNQGKLDEAASMKQEVLGKSRRVLGDEHPDTISVMNNLASTLGNQGKLDEAASMQQEVLEKSRRVLGDEHPDTISAMNNLACTLGDQGKLNEEHQ